jgi:DNA mismatch repair protein MutS
MLRLADIEASDLSPMMQQYVREKHKRPDCILLFRLGDFYETFFDDAVLVSQELELTLTSRDCGLEERAPMAGVPYHAADNYIEKLIDKGYKIAICEQMEDPALAKGLVKREVVQVITPGTTTASKALEDKSNHYLASVFQLGTTFGLAALDLSTGDFSATQFISGLSVIHLYDEIYRLGPAEILCNPAFRDSALAQKLVRENFFLTSIDDHCFDPKAYTNFYEESPLNQDLLRMAASGLLYYVEDTQKQLPSHIKPLEIYQIDQFMKLGAGARTNLELSRSLRTLKKKASLLWVLDQCKTAMGSRMLKRWLEQPLLHPAEINYRLDAVEDLKESFILRQELRDMLQGMNDMERLLSKLSMGHMNARELDALCRSLEKIPPVKENLQRAKSTVVRKLGQSLENLTDLVDTLRRGLADDLPILIQDGGVIRDGFDEQVDHYREIKNKGASWIVELEQREKDKTGIKNLKVGYNKVFGYYIDVTKSNLHLVPENYQRKQTLANSERYILPELKEMEDQMLHAEQRLLDREYEVFVELRNLAKAHEAQIAHNAEAIASLDAWLSLAEIADRYNYVRPEISLDPILDIEGGRHPVVERMLDRGAFVSNDAYLDRDDTRLILLTGPNMSGKSTYMRQIALIVILAQMGSFVPAERATIGIVDQIFTRIGASDDLASGQSTFMVEMNEVAYILENASARSLLILDEIGRGTSTYDGLAIAWAVVEHVANKNILGARTLFATHYHELTELEGNVAGVKNFHVAVRREPTSISAAKSEGPQEQEIEFLHKIQPGPADESYGVEVAKLAGVDQAVVNRARLILHNLENEGQSQARRQKKKDIQVMEGQMDLFSSSLALRQNDEVMDRLVNLDVQNMTPMEALQELFDLSQEAKKLKRYQGENENF